jgi:putative aldouronate transport system substrate-binding protein
MDLTDLLPEYAPNIWNRYPREQFNGASVGGKIYGIPQNAANHHLYMFTYREDLRKKYGLPDLTDLNLDNIELYLKTVLENEPGMQFAIPYKYSGSFGMYIPYLQKYDTIDSQGGIGASVVMLVERGTTNTICYYDAPEFVEWCERMKRWSDMGFWSKSVLANPDSTEPADLFKEGVVFASLSMHLDRATDVGEATLKEHPDWEINVIPYSTWTGANYNTRTTQDLTVIPNGSKNPERALMVIDKMMTDREYYDLTQYGILGLNYEFDENGAVSTANIDTTAHSFTVNLWALRNDDLKYPQFRFWDGRKAFEEKYFPISTFDPFDGFEVDLTEIQAEYAAIYQVRQEYGEPLDWGLVNDVESAVETYKQKMKEAGIDRFKEEIDKQVVAFVESR